MDVWWEIFIWGIKNRSFGNVRNYLYGDSGLKIFSEIEDEERFYSDKKTIKEIDFHCVK